MEWRKEKAVFVFLLSHLRSRSPRLSRLLLTRALDLLRLKRKIRDFGVKRQEKNSHVIRTAILNREKSKP